MKVLSSSSSEGRIVNLTNLLPPNAAALLERLLVLPWITDVEVIFIDNLLGCVVYHEYPEGVEIDQQVRGLILEWLREGHELKLEVFRGRFGHRPQLRREIDEGKRRGEEFAERTQSERSADFLDRLRRVWERRSR